MWNKKGVAQFAIFGVPVAVIFVFIIRLIAVNAVMDELEPALEQAMLKLDKSVVCPPDLKTDSYEVCISGRGEVIVTGTVNRDVSLELVSGQGNQYCSIQLGDYVDTKTCKFSELHKIENFDFVMNDGIKTLKVNSKNIELYILSNQFIKIPVKKWRGLLRVTRYVVKL